MQLAASQRVFSIQDVFEYTESNHITSHNCHQDLKHSHQADLAAGTEHINAPECLGRFDTLLPTDLFEKLFKSKTGSGNLANP